MPIRLRLLFAGILFLVAQFALGQSARLRVVDAVTGAPVPVASLINAEGVALATTTDDGLLAADPAAAYVVAPGYRAYKLSGTEGAVVRLHALQAQLPEVVAEGIRPQTFSLTDVQLTGARGIPKLGSGQAANLGQDIPYLIQQTPSAVATSDAGTGVGYTALRIRGSDATRTNVTLDGVPVNDAESQGTYWVDLPDLASSVSQVTVVRGVGSSTSGPGAFGAGVLLQTRQPSDSAFITADNSAGSFGTRRHSVQVGTGRFGNGFSAEARLSRIASNGYVDRATADLYSYLAVVRYRNARGLSARILHTSGHERTYQTWFGNLRSMAEADPTYNVSGTDYGYATSPYKNQVDDYRQDYWQLHVSSPLGAGWRIGGALFYTHGEGFYEEFIAAPDSGSSDVARYGFQPQTIRDSTTRYTDLVRRRWLRNDYYGATGTLQYDTGRHSLTLGALGSRYQGENFGRVVWTQSIPLPYPDYEYYSGPSVKQEVSGFAKYSYSLPAGLTLYADAQVRALDYRLSGTDNNGALLPFNKSWLFFNPKAAVSYDAGAGGRFSLSAAVAHREPTRTTFTDAGTRSYNPRPERLLDYELGYRASLGTLRPEVTFFYMDYYGQLVQTGQLNDVGNGIFRNVDRSYRAGIELQLAWLPSPKWIASGSVSLSQNRLRNFVDTLYDAEYNAVPASFSNTQIAFSPSVTAQGRVTWLPVRGLEATVLARYIGLQYLDNTQSADRALPAYALADVRIAYQLPVKALSALRVTAQLNNVTNARYSNNGYVYGPAVYVYPQAGRNVLVGLLISL